jgi:DNA-binding PadR family transcriptional regulator
MPTREKGAGRYRITPAGRATLARRRDALQELYGEVARRRN